MSAVFFSVMLNLVWNARDSFLILRDWLQSVQSHRICVAGTPAFQLASLVDIAGWKWVGAMVINRVTQHCFTPDSKQVCGGLSHVFRFDGILKLCVWVLVQSTMVSYWQSSRTDWLLTGVCCQRWESMNENAQLFGLRWKEKASAAQWHCCARQRACFFLLKRNVSHFLKIFLGFWWSIYSILHHSGRATVCLQLSALSASIPPCSAHLESRFSGFLSVAAANAFTAGD